MAGANYAAPMAHDKNVEPMHNMPSPLPAKVTWAIPTAAATSSVINLGDSTTLLEITAGGGTGVAFKWVKNSETAATGTAASVISSGLGVANFDHYVAPNATRRFVVPVDTSIVVQPASVMGANGQNGLYKRVAWITPLPVSSILATEY